MRIGVDARSLGAGRGVARYLEETLRALADGWPEDELVLLVPGRPQTGGRICTSQTGGRICTLGPHAQKGVTADVRVVRHALPGRALFGAGALVGRPRLDRLLGGGLDVLWLPAPAPVALGGDVPYVVTVHDLSWLQRPEDFTPYERLWHRLGRLDAQARGAARLVAVSGATRDEVVTRWGIDPTRIDVVLNGVWRPPAERRVSPGLGLAEARRHSAPYLLCVAALEPRKGLDTLVEAHALARRDGLRAELFLAGGGRLRGELEGREGVRLEGAVGPERLEELYAGALAVVLPSLLEGFGMPPLEGLARGVPAIVTDLPVYDETLGAGALRFAPGDAPALAAAMLRLEREPGLREQLVDAGQEATAQLTWERSAVGLHTALGQAAAR